MPANRRLDHDGRLAFGWWRRGGVVIVGEEAPHAEQIEHLGGALFVGSDEVAHHGLLVVAHIGEFEVECEIDVAHLSAELDQAVDRGAVVAEIASDVQIGQ